MTRNYLLLAVLGAIVPCMFFGDFMLDHGVNLTEFLRQLFVNSPASGFTSDLLITSAAFWIWSFCEARLQGMRNWWVYVVLNLGVGLSCALPLFLFFRQLCIEHKRIRSP
jgi:hypothetical protein